MGDAGVAQRRLHVSGADARAPPLSVHCPAARPAGRAHGSFRGKSLLLAPVVPHPTGGKDVPCASALAPGEHFRRRSTVSERSGSRGLVWPENTE
jgi:hypothetical protein